MNRYLLYLMLIFGECLIIAGFFLFAPIGERTAGRLFLRTKAMT